MLSRFEIRLHANSAIKIINYKLQSLEEREKRAYFFSLYKSVAKYAKCNGNGNMIMHAMRKTFDEKNIKCEAVIVRDIQILKDKIKSNIRIIIGTHWLQFQVSNIIIIHLWCHFQHLFLFPILRSQF